VLPDSVPKEGGLRKKADFLDNSYRFGSRAERQPGTVRLQSSVCGLRSCGLERIDVHSFARGQNAIHPWRDSKLSRNASTNILGTRIGSNLVLAERTYRSRFEIPDRRAANTQEEGRGVGQLARAHAGRTRVTTLHLSGLPPGSMVASTSRVSNEGALLQTLARVLMEERPPHLHVLVITQHEGNCAIALVSTNLA